MSKKGLSNLFKEIKRGAIKNSPEILTGIGVAGMITTTILSVKATPKALQLIEQRKEELDVDKLSAKETIKTTWKCYIPALVTGTSSIGCIMGASSVNSKRNAALATAYKIAEESLATYKEKVIETIGEKKEHAILEKIDKDKVDNNPVTKSEIIITGNGESLFYEELTGRYFESDIEKIRKVINELNYRMIINGEMYISLSEFYDEIGLKHTNVSDYMGWNISRDGQIDIRFGSQIADNGKPCIVMDYAVKPNYDFDRF